MLRDEVLIIGLASADIRKGKPLSDTDHDRLLKAVNNVRDAYRHTKQEKAMEKEFEWVDDLIDKP